jgi:disulfide bond formation protein DsbB
MFSIANARLAAVAIPVVLLAGAYVAQYGFGLFPCEMCWWQRYPHFAAIGLGALGLALQPARVWTALAALAIIVSGLIGGFHAGVEYGWWQGITGCSTLPSGLDVMNPSAAPLVRCDAAPWTLGGISLAGFNFLISAFAGAAILTVATYKR